jgi:hypothetical protein
MSEEIQTSNNGNQAPSGRVHPLVGPLGYHWLFDGPIALSVGFYCGQWILRQQGIEYASAGSMTYGAWLFWFYHCWRSSRPNVPALAPCESATTKTH